MMFKKFYSGPNYLNRELTDTQVDKLFFGFNPQYQVIPDGYVEYLSGFSATAFRNGTTGKLSIAIFHFSARKMNNES